MHINQKCRRLHHYVQQINVGPEIAAAMASGSLNFRLQPAEAVHHFIYAELSRFGVNKCKKYRGRLEEEGNIKEERSFTFLLFFVIVSIG